MLLSGIDLPPSAAQSQSQLPHLAKSMELETALEFVDSLVFAQTGKYLSDVQRVVFRASWPPRRQTYDEMATDNDYSANYFKQDVGPKLWKLLSTVLGEKVSKSNFQAALERRRHSLLSNALGSQKQPLRDLQLMQQQEQIATRLSWGEAVGVSVFLGRTEELAALQQ